VKKIACVIYFYGKAYQELGRCAVNSFKKHHPEVDMFHINEENSGDYRATESLISGAITGGSYKYLLAAEIMIKHKYDKIIVLGADTITCARLDEFVDNDEDDILIGLDYPYQLIIEGRQITPPLRDAHVNADVSCFNSVKPLLETVRIAKRFGPYAEQGALNYIIWSGEYDFSYNIVDGPYDTSDVIYNARAKGNIAAGPGEKPWGKFTNKFYIKNDKLYSWDNKQIKVWHYCEGLGNVSDQTFIKLMNNWIFDWFNSETKQFFKEQCDCGDFFEKEFTF
tara:strand:- start:1287 stop:2129 length:843 start_codon:yes stop_codon:yes gene_type:complete